MSCVVWKSSTLPVRPLAGAVVLADVPVDAGLAVVVWAKAWAGTISAIGATAQRSFEGSLDKRNLALSKGVSEGSEMFSNVIV